jgi:hypothetical protein
MKHYEEKRKEKIRLLKEVSNAIFCNVRSYNNTTNKK